MHRRATLFTVLVSGCSVAAIAAVGAAVLAQQGRTASATGQKVRTDALARPYLMFRSMSREHGVAGFGVVTTARAAGGPQGRRSSVLHCERVYASTTGGLCLARAGSLIGAYKTKIFGPDLRVVRELSLSGVPSRARVSPDGRYGATTTFVTGHSYADPGKFSTQTTLVDMRRGRRVADLEDFEVTQAGRVIDAPDLNFWGVTFARDSDRFFATMATGGRGAQIGNRGGTHLIEGQISTRTARVIHDNVECPSLSPDGTRIAYKKLVGHDPAIWRFHVLDLATGRETALAETRPVDDQLEWLDDDNVLYGSGEDIWAVPADGTGAPRRLLAHADSPAVVR